MPRKAGAAFGRPLQEQFSSSNGLPHVLQRTLALLSQHGMCQADLFLRETDVRKVSLMRQAWDRGQDPSRYAPVTDASAVARLLVQWLEALPQPLLPCQLYRPLVRISLLDSAAQQVTALQRLLSQTDPCTQQVLGTLLAFLHRHALESGVSAEQLTTVFAPLLLRTPQWQSICDELQHSQCDARQIVGLLVSEAPEIMRKDRALARASPPLQPSNKQDVASEPQSHLKVKLRKSEPASQAKSQLTAQNDSTQPSAPMLISPDASPPNRASCMDSLPTGCLSAYRGNAQNLSPGQSPPASPRHASLSRQSSLSSASVASQESSMDGLLDDLCSSAIASVLLSDDKRPFQQQFAAPSRVQLEESTAVPMDHSPSLQHSSSSPSIQENAYACMPSGEQSLSLANAHSSCQSAGSFEDIPLSPFCSRDAGSWERQRDSVAA